MRQQKSRAKTLGKFLLRREILVAQVPKFAKGFG